MTPPEFTHPLRLDTLGDRPLSVSLSADEAARERLAARFGLIGLARLDAEAEVRRAGEVVQAEGRLRAEATQACIATGEPVPAAVDERFVLRFVPEEQIVEGEEFELSEADCDTIGYTGALIDLGEAIAETLSLALPDFPRCDGADAMLREAGVLTEEEAAALSSPFAGLAAIKRD